MSPEPKPKRVMSEKSKAALAAGRAKKAADLAARRATKTGVDMTGQADTPGELPPGAPTIENTPYTSKRKPAATKKPPVAQPETTGLEPAPTGDQEDGEPVPTEKPTGNRSTGFFGELGKRIGL